MYVLADGSIEQAATPQSVCLVQSGFRCRYFEQSVLPLTTVGRYVGGVPFPGAEEEYAARVNRGWRRGESSEPKHPLCQPGEYKQDKPTAAGCSDCGAPRAKGAQYCPACSERRKGESSKRRVARHRGTAVEV